MSWWHHITSHSDWPTTEHKQTQDIMPAERFLRTILYLCRVILGAFTTRNYDFFIPNSFLGQALTVAVIRAAQ